MKEVAIVKLILWLAIAVLKPQCAQVPGKKWTQSKAYTTVAISESSEKPPFSTNYLGPCYSVTLSSRAAVKGVDLGWLIP